MKSPDFRAPSEPHAVLADLPLPIYMTTNYDDFMVKALGKPSSGSASRALSLERVPRK